MFNDHPLTTHGLVLTVLHQARANIVNGALDRPPTPAQAPAGTKWASRLKPLEQLRRLFA